ncbi:MAG: cell division protein FtsQ [Brevundimonas sp.]|jgi:cell division protein FtsQ|uniref:cell division protein FtsQ/DivIB n=1 Tax=Brevundimonas sp. TaxID=1871086 RepID=UPI0039E5B63A
MPAVVRGGRRQSSNQAPRKSAPRKGAPRRGGSRNAPATPGKMAALGRLDLSPRAVIISFVAGVVLVGAVLFTGARADRIGASISSGVNNQLAGMGLALTRVHVTGASDEARPAIQAAIDLQRGQPITAVDLDAVRASVEQVGWVRSARVVRLLPDTLVVAVTEHDRLAVWQTGGRNYVVDSTGQVIPGADPGRYPRLPLVVGTGAAEAASDILPLLRQRPRLMSRVEALVRVDERRWDVRLRDGGVIQLPASNQEAALIQLDSMDQRERLLDLGFERVDLRAPDAVAVQPTGEA